MRGERCPSIKDSWLTPAAGEDRWEEGLGQGEQAMEMARKCGQPGGEGRGTPRGKAVAS